MPSPQTKQSAAIAGANQLMNLAAQAIALRAAAADAVKQYNSEQWENTWGAMQTCAQNADGTLGAADATPNPAHPLNTGTYLGLARAATPNQLTAMVTFLSDFASFLGNAAVSTAQRSQTLDDLVS